MGLENGALTLLVLKARQKAGTRASPTALGMQPSLIKPDMDREEGRQRVVRQQRWGKGRGK